jgi:hypothetical protein
MGTHLGDYMTYGLVMLRAKDAVNEWPFIRADIVLVVAALREKLEFGDDRGLWHACRSWG